MPQASEELRAKFEDDYAARLVLEGAGMYTPSLKQIKALRETSGAGLVDCKIAIVACHGFVDLAQRWLEVKGVAVSCAPEHHPTAKVEWAARERLATQACRGGDCPSIEDDTNPGRCQYCGLGV